MALKNPRIIKTNAPSAVQRFRVTLEVDDPETAGYIIPVRVDFDIDLLALSKKIAPKALTSKAGRSVLAGGAIKCKVTL